MEREKKTKKTNNNLDRSDKGKKAIIRRKLNGIVISARMDKTIIVRVDRVKKAPKYGKRYITSKKYKVHDERSQLKEDDKVTFVECRPISKEKRWRALYK